MHVNMSGKDMKINCLTLHHLKNWSAEDPAAFILIFCYITTYRAPNPKSSGGLWWLYHQFLHSKMKGTAEGKQDFFSCGNKRRILKLLLYRKIIVLKWGQYWYLVQSWWTSLRDQDACMQGFDVELRRWGSDCYLTAHLLLCTVPSCHVRAGSPGASWHWVIWGQSPSKRLPAWCCLQESSSWGLCAILTTRAVTRA